MFLKIDLTPPKMYFVFGAAQTVAVVENAA